MTRAGIPLKQYPLDGGVVTGLSYPILFEEFEACVAGGLDLHEWHYGTKYPVTFKNQVIAWYRTRRAIESHVNDAQTKEMKRKGRK